jgi:hypothetical protein
MTDRLSCFVITGFGEKTDPLTGRLLNLTVVYEKILKPVCDSFTDPPIDCFRACDKLYTGTIDAFMYKWILDADIAIADISTLNPNAIYELGVRYALKPYSTIVISESELKFPFDFGHVLIQQYRHGGKDIDDTEVIAFSAKLKELIHLTLDRIKTESNTCNDSPVYEFLKDDILPPRKKKKKAAGLHQVAGWDKAVSVVLQKTDEGDIIKNNLLEKVSQSEVQQITTSDSGAPKTAADLNDSALLKIMYLTAYKNIGLDKNLVEKSGPYAGLLENIPTVGYRDVSFVLNDLNKTIMDQKDKGLKNKDIRNLPEILDIVNNLKSKLKEEKLSLSELMTRAEEKKNDNLLKESLAYFALALELDPNSRLIHQRIVLITYKLREPDEFTALKLAENLLLTFLRPDEVIDVETFGLAGAIYKRLAKWEQEMENVGRSIKYYEKGYIVCNDYYNGVNCAYMYMVSAAGASNLFDRVTQYGNAQKIWKNVVAICEKELAAMAADPKNKDRVWILQSKAQALLGLNAGKLNEEIDALISQVKLLDNLFSVETFVKQNADLILLIEEVVQLIGKAT